MATNSIVLNRTGAFAGYANNMNDEDDDEDSDGERRQSSSSMRNTFIDRSRRRQSQQAQFAPGTYRFAPYDMSNSKLPYGGSGGGAGGSIGVSNNNNNSNGGGSILPNYNAMMNAPVKYTVPNYAALFGSPGKMMGGVGGVGMGVGGMGVAGSMGGVNANKIPYRNYRPSTDEEKEILKKLEETSGSASKLLPAPSSPPKRHRGFGASANKFNEDGQLEVGEFREKWRCSWCLLSGKFTPTLRRGPMGSKVRVVGAGWV